MDAMIFAILALLYNGITQVNSIGIFSWQNTGKLALWSFWAR
jgi:hypothetical protein